jgi:hypothetical protein
MNSDIIKQLKYSRLSDIEKFFIDILSDINITVTSSLHETYYSKNNLTYFIYNNRTNVMRYNENLIARDLLRKTGMWFNNNNKVEIISLLEVYLNLNIINIYPIY